MTHAAAHSTPYGVPRAATAARHRGGHRSLGTALRGWVARNLVGDDPYVDLPSYLDRMDHRQTPAASPLAR